MTQLRRVLDENLSEDKVAVHAKNLHDLEDRNDHSGYVIYLAKMARDPALLKAAKAIDVLHDTLGHMPNDLYAARATIRKTVVQRLRQKMGSDFERMMGTV